MFSQSRSLFRMFEASFDLPRLHHIFVFEMKNDHVFHCPLCRSSWWVHVFCRCRRWGTSLPQKTMRSPRVHRGCCGCRWQMATPPALGWSLNTCPKSGTFIQMEKISLKKKKRKEKSVLVLQFKDRDLCEAIMNHCVITLFKWIEDFSGFENFGLLLKKEFDFASVGGGLWDSSFTWKPLTSLWLASCSLLVLATTGCHVVMSHTKSTKQKRVCNGGNCDHQAEHPGGLFIAEKRSCHKSVTKKTKTWCGDVTERQSQFCIIGCLKSTCRALRSPRFNSLSTFPSEHAPSNPSTFYQLVSCGGSNHPITLYVPQLRCISILVMVVLATAAMVTRQVSTGGVS